MKTLLRGGKSIFVPQQILYNNKITTSGLISSKNLPREDFQTGNFISWHQHCFYCCCLLV